MRISPATSTNLEKTVNDMDKIEKIRQEIERNRQAMRVLNEHTTPEQMSKTCAIFQYSDSILSELLSFLDTLSEEPDKSMEEAAEEYAKNNYLAPDFMVENLDGKYDSEIDEYKFCTADAFKAGAEWMAEQGVKATASVGYYNQCGLSILTEPSIKKLGFKEGDELEVILRKK